MGETQKHPSHWMFQALIGKTVSAVDYMDDCHGGITLLFADGSFLCVTESMQVGQIDVAASIRMEEY